uniref:Granulin b n=1 Tax=Nothobranchius rachovii TaxID=451742 RepID=A0A1A8NME6_9TELE
MTLWMGFLAVVLLGLSSALVCPDGGTCEDKETCCKNNSGGYGCCPLPHAECCSDHLHCCYEGTLCDLIHQKCVNKTVSLPWVRRLPTKQSPPVPQLGGSVKAVLCPDHESECPDDTTCCQLPDSSWGCCPLPKAVCCEDKRHCCPEGTTCDLVHSKCVSPSFQSIPLLEKLPAKRLGNKLAVAVICPGGKSSCPDAYTCCLLTSGEYGCCPYPDATCCSDHSHCCPSNTICDLEHGVCRSAEVLTPLMEKIPAVSTDVVCPDRKSACPDQTTCCLMKNGTYGCCPLPNAVCCSDYVHCCPADTQCDLQHSTCVPAQDNMSVSKVFAAVRLQSRVVPCNDSVSCADGSTCCKSAGGGWACCPLAQAVCCEDHLHCCPHGSVCNLEAKTCDDPSGFPRRLQWLTKVPALRSKQREETCDEQTCPRGNTCCKGESGLWACCPLPQAVCCSDQQHCCPQGFRCNVAKQSCDRVGHLSLPWFQKVPGRKNEPSWVDSSRAPSDRIVCDAQTSCPKDTTCCFMEKTHKWGCCPLPQAVCCQGGNHCCPSGHTCEPHRSTCSRGPNTIAWFTKLSARTEPMDVSDVKCDNKSSCASGTTCCRLQSGEWGCCPLVKAVCCDDHEHCCPQGYSCNMKTSTCEKKIDSLLLTTLPQSEVVRSEPREAEDDGDVSCDSTGVFHCSKQETCCKVSDTEWSCCPTHKAVCCSDSKHCCPVGFSCDLKAGGCTQNQTWGRNRDFFLLGF